VFKWDTRRFGVGEFDLFENVITPGNDPDFRQHLDWSY
jgi:hypothetical protein